VNQHSFCQTTSLNVILCKESLEISPRRRCFRALRTSRSVRTASASSGQMARHRKRSLCNRSADGGVSCQNTTERVASSVGHQSPMKSRFAAFLCVLAVFQLMGGHWAVLQATAWVGMLVKYSESEGVEVGITKTFDGKHPCDLCLSIAKNKQTEKKQSSQLAAAKIYLVAPAQRWRLQPARYSWRLRTTIASLVGCDSGPPVPPPRVS